LDEHVRPLDTVRRRAVAQADSQVSADSHIALKQNRVAVIGFDIAGDILPDC
jgi:hypothetical protein